MPRRLAAPAGASLLRGTALVAAALVALALVVVPMVDRGTSERFADGGQGLDMMATGSIGSGTTAYTIRRSVLQAPGSAPCITFADGSRRGSC
ncbi:hypothetical protein J1C47_11645 [Jiella sp. MQZ13P-4]|uniref:Uncharacterized protein n=1 Tax=Jiella sonneratiae TaxID=2816856 RepID=A0ABS3J3N9_9HYPH|nr:hypothetical protein [Jiella sonneratiae]